VFDAASADPDKLMDPAPAAPRRASTAVRSADRAGWTGSRARRSPWPACAASRIAWPARSTHSPSVSGARGRSCSRPRA